MFNKEQHGIDQEKVQITECDDCISSKSNDIQQKTFSQVQVDEIPDFIHGSKKPNLQMPYVSRKVKSKAPTPSDLD